MKQVFLTLFMLLAYVSLGQDSPEYYVQFKIKQVSSEQQAKEIDKKMKSRKEIVSTHTDHVTSTYFCSMSGEAEYVFEDFEHWFEKLGYEIVCFNKGINGDGRMMSPHELKNCEESNTE